MFERVNEERYKELLKMFKYLKTRCDYLLGVMAAWDGVILTHTLYHKNEVIAKLHRTKTTHTYEEVSHG